MYCEIILKLHNELVSFADTSNFNEDEVATYFLVPHISSYEGLITWLS